MIRVLIKGAEAAGTDLTPSLTQASAITLLIWTPSLTQVLAITLKLVLELKAVMVRLMTRRGVATAAT